jgi:hypothetical protein
MTYSEQCLTALCIVQTFQLWVLVLIAVMIYNFKK